MASRTMRRVLIDYAHQRNAAKRGGVRKQLTLEETTEVLGTSAPTAMRDLRFAQAWLARELAGER